jgi:hypothetical protein
VTLPEPRSEGHRLLLAHHARRPAMLLARRLDTPERTVREWLRGVTPRWHWRERLQAVLGIPELSWFDPPQAPETPPGNSVGGSVAGGGRFSTQKPPKSESVTPERSPNET